MKPLSPYSLNILWLTVTAMLIIGISQPMFTFTHFYFFDDTFSLLSGIFHLLAQNEYILFSLLFCFSVLFPALKLLVLLYCINTTLVDANKLRYLERLGVLGKWSMLDVFVVAILAVTIKLSMVAQVTIHSGLIIFSIGVVTSMMLPQLIKSPRLTDDRVSLLLTVTEIDRLFAHGRLALPKEQHVEHSRLVDIVDQKGCWQAKVQCDHNNETAELVLLAQRKPL